MEAAVEGYANGVLKSSVGKLGSFLWGEALLVGTVRQDIQYIRDELMSMNAVLQDMISSGYFNHQLKAWMIQVLTVACDAELCTDEFKEKLDTRPGSGLPAAVLHYIRSLSTRYRIAKDIQALKSRAKEVSERRSRYSIMFDIPTVLMKNKNPESTWVTSKRDTGLIQYNHLVAEGALVGIHNDDTHKICKKVATEDWFKMLVIVGPAGSGKTALARMVYRRRNHNFGKVIRTAAWVTVSDKPDMKRVLEEILRQVAKSPLQGIKEYDVKWLSDKLREELANARYLIVLDSLWSVEDWQTLKDALPGTGKGRVVVTTRKENVAEECCCDISDRARQRYDMQPLREEQLDKLIIELLSNDRLERAHSELWGKVRKAILNTCSVPLALKCLCGALAAVYMDKRWLDIMRRDLLSVYEKFPDQEDRTKELLKYCWSEYLPPSLKQCSQDLSNLPEHYAINRKLLMRRWIAKGFIKLERGLSVEEVAESYFNNLISRCIIEPESVHPTVL